MRWSWSWKVCFQSKIV